MGWRGTVFLLLGVILAAGAYFATREEQRVELPDETLLGEPRYSDPAQRGKKLVDIDPADVTRIVLQVGNDQAISERTASGWTGNADARQLDDFFSSLTDLREIVRIESGAADLASYGLNPPARLIVLDRKNGTSIRLAAGDRNPAATAVYVRIDDGPVTLAGALLLWEFDKLFAALSGRPLHG
jgi:hypothetical protein